MSDEEKKVSRELFKQQYEGDWNAPFNELCSKCNKPIQNVGGAWFHAERDSTHEATP